MIQRIDARINKIRPGFVDEIVKIVLAKLNETDDFTLINGIGPTIAQRLVDANVKTFLQLSKMTIQEVADILITSPENVKRLRIIPQAQELAAQQ
jgi:predicted flap endonuclease-1-like 5' DNA nuclease